MRILILIEPLRKGQELSSRQLADISGISHTEIARIESGEVSPTLDTLLCLADALGVGLKDTFVELGPKGKSQK